jgi:hypothetical protein
MAERYAGKGERVEEVRSGGATGPFQESIERRPRRNPIADPDLRLTRDDLEAWRKPDVYTDSSDLGWVIAIWYGPGGVEGENATEVEVSNRIIDVTEYQYLPGLVDDVPPGEEFLQTEYSFDKDELYAALKEVGIRKPRSNLALVKHAAAYGVQMLSFWGGTENYTDELPR